MKFTSTAISVACLLAKSLIGVRADGELIASWVQFTGADMQNPECAELIQNPALIKDRTIKADKHGPGCHFSAEVRAIYNGVCISLCFV